MSFNIPVGEHIIELSSIDSTNNYLSKLINETNVPNGTVILTYNQTKGRGQRGNTWNSAPNKNLSCSYLINLKKIRISDVFLISMAVANAIHKFISVHFKNGFIKWPNDILVDNKKICGVLIENNISGKLISQSVIGIGINVNQEIFDNLPHATSFKLEKDMNWNIKNLFKELNIFLSTEINALNSGYTAKIRNYYLNNLLGYNTQRRYREVNNSNAIFEGEILDIENSGVLVMKKGLEIKRYQFKEIEFIL